MYRFECDPAWVDAFLASMQMDIDQREYKTLDDTVEYIYGSAEVIGLFMAKILDLPEESYESAKMQGRAMQFINFIRDIDEDIDLGRCYFPEEDLKTYGLDDLSEAEVKKKPESFQRFIHMQIDRYQEWQMEADKGLQFIPKRLRVAVKSAIEGYNWTAEEIRKTLRLFMKNSLNHQKVRF